MVPSTELRSRAERVIQNPVPPRELGELCGECCPYELMMQAARTTDVVILNYHHLFDREIREQLYANLGVEPQDVLLLIDEAHNCGDTITAIGTVTMEQRDLEQASRELAGMRGRHKGADAVRHVLPRLTEFMKGLENSAEAEDWFDPAIFDRMIVRESLYKAMDEIVDDLIGIAETIREKNQKAGEFRETAIERLTEFLLRLSQSATDPAIPDRVPERGCGDHARSPEHRPGRCTHGSLRRPCLCSPDLRHALPGRKFPEILFRRYAGHHARPAQCLPEREPARCLRKRHHDRVLDAAEQGQHHKGRGLHPGLLGPEREPGDLLPQLPDPRVLRRARNTPPAGQAGLHRAPGCRGCRCCALTFLSLPLRGESGVMFAVCGGKWSEGLDYRGEMLNGAMVVGLPLAPFNRVRRMMIDYFRHKFGAEGEFLCYTLPAINRSLQALGRVLRTPEDKGVLVLAEKRFLENRVRSALPGWIQEEMIACDAAGFREVIGDGNEQRFVPARALACPRGVARQQRFTVSGSRRPAFRGMFRN